MEDALISPAGFMILSGAGLIEASEDKKIIVHSTERTANVQFDKETNIIDVIVTEKPYLGKTADGTTYIDADNAVDLKQATEDFIYVMFVDESGDIVTEPFIPTAVEKNANGGYKLSIATGTAAEKLNGREKDYTPYGDGLINDGNLKYTIAFVDYYVAHTEGAQQIDITPDKFGGNYYLEASTLFRTQDGVDMPAEFIIPNCKIQSNFTFTMASSGDPSSFTFTMDAFPDYTRFDKTKKVLAAVQIIEEGVGANSLRRASTAGEKTHKEDSSGAIVEIKP